MKRLLSFIIVLIPLVLYSQSLKFEDYFENNTLNLEVYHSGRYALEYYNIDNSYISGPWAASKTKLIDYSNFGAHKVEIFGNNNVLIYSKTYSSLFEEWSTTSDGKNSCGNFEEVIRIPFPKEEVIIRLYSKDSIGNWKEISKLEWNKSMLGNPLIEKSYFPIKLHYSGEINKKLDIIIISAGYAKSDSIKMRKDFDLFSGFIFSKSPFQDLKNEINIWGLEYFSEESGIPGIKNSEIEPNTELGVSYNTFNSPRYIMTEKLFNLHSILRNSPYDQIIIMCNSNIYGGGGIYNFYATSYVNPNNSYVVIHEFGHSFAGLGDEYAENDSEIEGASQSCEPWQPNLTTLKDFSRKWKNDVKQSIPIPTPCIPQYKDEIGVYEGAAYVSKGIYRPYQNCLMRSDEPFCSLCSKSIIEMMKFYTE